MVAVAAASVLIVPPLAFEGAARLLPYPDAGHLRIQPSTAVLDRAGRPLAEFTAADGRWCLPTPIGGHGRWLPLAVEAVEDARFRSHGGVDWYSVAGALAEDIAARRVVRGASTITMQLQRLRQPSVRSFRAKLVEALRARQIELRQDKDGILAEWLERASFGGNVVGAGAAAWRWFGVPPASLSLAQAALIAGLPQSPERLRPDRHGEAARERRDHVLRRMQVVGVIDAQQLAQALAEPVALVLRDPPPAEDLGAAPILADLAATQRGVLATTLDLTIQRCAVTLMREHLAGLAGSGVTAGAAAVLELGDGNGVSDGGWLALVSIGGPVWLDLTTVRRSSGSTLKPFIYAGAFARGIVTPASQVEDDPAGWRGWLPQNYDRAWRGRCSAAEALRDSRNLPAMRLLEQQGLARGAGIMEGFGLAGLGAQAERSGLALAIGGAEVDVRSLAGACAGLASGHRALPHLLAGKDLQAGAEVLPPAACLQALSCLVDRERTLAVCPAAVALEPAWKTGTSSGHRDAWCVALTPRRCVVVWLGTTQGPGSPALVGAEVAAPLALSLLAACDPGGATWPSAGMGAATPVHATVLASPLVITHPATGIEVLRDPDAATSAQRLSLECRGGGSGPRWWFVDGMPLSTVAVGDPAWWTPSAGSHDLRVVDGQGHSASAAVVVR